MLTPSAAMRFGSDDHAAGSIDTAASRLSQSVSDKIVAGAMTRAVGCGPRDLGECGPIRDGLRSGFGGAISL